MNIPDEVIEQARIAADAEYRNTPWGSDASDKALRTAAPIIAEWARKEALREAAEAMARVELEERPEDYHKPDLIWVFDAVSAIRALAEGDTNA